MPPSVHGTHRRRYARRCTGFKGRTNFQCGLTGGHVKYAKPESVGGKPWIIERCEHHVASTRNYNPPVLEEDDNDNRDSDYQDEDDQEEEDTDGEDKEGEGISRGFESSDRVPRANNNRGSNNERTAAFRAKAPAQAPFSTARGGSSRKTPRPNNRRHKSAAIARTPDSSDDEASVLQYTILHQLEEITERIRSLETR